MKKLLPVTGYITIATLSRLVTSRVTRAGRVPLSVYVTIGDYRKTLAFQCKQLTVTGAVDCCRLIVSMANWDKHAIEI